jgi:hypothetical protein
MKKIAGVESVEVKLKEGRALIRLKPGNTVRLEDVEHRVRENGFHPKEAAVIARGEIVSAGDKVQLNIAGPNQMYSLAVSSEQLVKLKSVIGKAVSVEGTVPAAKEKSISHTIQLKSFTVQP